ncbi:MAG TPA: LamG-like jellyroll fold domain-containing protein [Actinomycetota bacterium]|nr:LamG-like jellyroll fold domain-containing protein [Actinomycetota bacterium]
MTEHAAVFDGLDDYIEIADHPDYSIAGTGELTVVALIRPDSLEMPNQERTGYVHWLGKGVPGQDEWTFRMYQLGNTEGRGNRISCYAFNLDARAGGIRFGIGSHFQDELTPGQWLLVAGAWDATRVSIYRDGVLRDSDLLDQSATGGVTITPEDGDAPVRIGTRDLNSFFLGAISRVAIFNRRLADGEQAALQTARAGGTLDGAISDTAGLVGFWRLGASSGGHEPKG